MILICRLLFRLFVPGWGFFDRVGCVFVGLFRRRGSGAGWQTLSLTEKTVKFKPLVLLRLFHNPMGNFNLFMAGLPQRISEIESKPKKVGELAVLAQFGSRKLGIPRDELEIKIDEF